MAEVKSDAVRIQTSVLNAVEKKVLVWLAERQPRWMTSDILTIIGSIGAATMITPKILSVFLEYIVKNIRAATAAAIHAPLVQVITIAHTKSALATKLRNLIFELFARMSVARTNGNTRTR